MLSLPTTPLPPALAPHALPVLDRLNDLLACFKAFRHDLPLPPSTGMSLSSLGLGTTDLSRRMLAKTMVLDEASVEALFLSSLATLATAASAVGSQKKHFLELFESSTVEDVQREYQIELARRTDEMVDLMLAQMLVEGVEECVADDEGEQWGE